MILLGDETMTIIIRAARRTLLPLLGLILGAGLMFTDLSCVPVVDLGESVEYPYVTHEFDHVAHLRAKGCGECHHVGANLSCDASGCHQSEWVGGVPNLKEAKHRRCLTCHGNETTAEGSTRCSFCHTALAG